MKEIKEHEVEKADEEGKEGDRCRSSNAAAEKQ